MNYCLVWRSPNDPKWRCKNLVNRWNDICPHHEHTFVEDDEKVWRQIEGVQDNPTLRMLSATAPTDMKAGVGGVKAPLSQLPKAALVYGSRAFQYGASKYKPGNYLRPPGSGNDTERLLDYISAAQRHLAAWATEIMRSVGEGRGALELKQACFAADDESGLPHACHALASLNMGVQQAVDAGLMPADPGVTWGKKDK